MVQFKVGDVVTLCASIRDWCFYTPYYEIFDINISTGSCGINYTTFGCLSPSGIQLDFQWTNTRNNTPTHNCDPTNNIKLLGSATTNSQGIASMSYTIVQGDLDLFNANATFDLRVCIRNTPDVDPSMIGKTRSQVGHQFDDMTIVQDPCVGVTCDNACVGLDLYSQICIDGSCITDTLIEQNSLLCGAVQEKHYMYFKVAELYPVSYVVPFINPIFFATAQAIGAYTDYQVEAVDFDPITYIITITISKIPQLGLGTNPRMQTMFLPLIPIAYYLAVLAGAIAAILSVLILDYLGSKSVTGEQVSTRVITVVPKICVGNANTGVPDCSNPVSPMIISVERCLGDNCETIEIADGNPITFSSPTNVGITITGKVKNSIYYTTIKKTIDKGTTNETVTLEFIAKEDATIDPNAVDSTTGHPITGSYIVYEETVDGNMVEIIRGNLDANGKINPPFKAKADVKTCIIIIPVDIAVHKPQMECMTPSGGDHLTPPIPIKTCAEAKNHISVRTVYISTIDESRIGFTADSIQIKIGPDVVNTVIPTTDITYIDNLAKNTNYTVHVTKANYNILNNDQPASFTTDCDTTVALLVESNPPPGSRDITIEVKNATTNAAIQGANVTLDTMPIKKTGPSGTVILTAIPDGNHDLTITLEAYKDNISTISVSPSSTSFTKTLTVDQVNATVDTRIYDFVNIGDAIATKPIKFGGKLEYLKNSSYEALTDATVTVTIRDVDNIVLETLVAITKNGLTELGDFETGTWVIPEGLTDSQINVDATFDGIGSYKPSSFSTSYAVAAKDACLVPLPWGGCLLSKEAGTGLLLLGALAVGGVVLLSSGAKSLTGGASERIIERPIPPHYTPPEIKKE